MTKQNRNTWLFIGFLLLAGIANLSTRTAIPELDTLMACINYLILIGLLLFWIEAVRVRLLPSAARTSILCAAILMMLHMLMRIFKYRFAVSIIAMRYAVYAYWIPQMLIPALFLMTCIRIRRGGQEKKKWNERLLLIPAVILALMAMTNDLHSLVYVPRIELPEFILDTGTYSYGFGFYLMYIWMILTVLLGLVILFLKAGQMPKRAVLLLVCVIAVVGLALLEILVIEKYFNHRMFMIPEIHIFSLLGIFEICIQYRLIPYNENYSGFFQKLQFPTVITDKDFKPIFCSETTLPADQSLLKEAIKEPVSLSEDLQLYGKAIRAGYAFWAEDESAVHQMQEQLLEANEMIEQENDLIRAETKQKEQDAYLQSRHRIYHEIAEELYPSQKKIAQILNEAVPGKEGFKEKIVSVTVLNAYIKRKTNLLLLMAENDKLSVNELFLALQESANYLTMAGLQTTVTKPEQKHIPAGVIIALYDSFEAIAQQLKGKTPSLMVSWHRDGLRLAAEVENEPDTSEIPLPVQFRRSEDVVYMDIFAGKGGEAL